MIKCKLCASYNVVWVSVRMCIKGGREGGREGEGRGEVGREET